MGLEEMTVDQLKAELERQEAIKAEAFQLFKSCDESEYAMHIDAFWRAWKNIEKIKQELRRRKNEKDS